MTFLHILFLPFYLWLASALWALIFATFITLFFPPKPKPTEEDLMREELSRKLAARKAKQVSDNSS